MLNSRIIYFLSIFFYSYFISIGCTVSYKRKVEDRDIEAVRILVSFPTLTQDGVFIAIQDSFFINYYKNLVIYKLPSAHVSAYQKFDKDGNVEEEKILSRKTKFNYFVYAGGEKNGWYFDSLRIEKAKMKNVDSFTRERFSINSVLFFNDRDSLVQRISQQDGDFTEKYVRTRKTDRWDCDTSELTFSGKYNNIGYSFHKQLDSLKGRKLTVARFISLPDSLNTEPYFRFKREVRLSMEKVIGADYSDIIEIAKKVPGTN